MALNLPDAYLEYKVAFNLPKVIHSLEVTLNLADVIHYQKLHSTTQLRLKKIKSGTQLQDGMLITKLALDF